MRAFVDTNVFVYAHDRGEPAKRDVALALLRAPGAEVVISAQVLAEFFVAVTAKLATPLPVDVAAAHVKGLSQLPVVPIDRDVVGEAIELHRSASLSYWDAAIVAAARRAGCATLLTEDLADGQAIAGVAVRNPFASS